MRSLPAFTKLFGLCIVVALIALAGFSQMSARAGAPAQATMAATTATSGGTGGASATMAATMTTSGGVSATMAATTYPPCPPSATASAAGTMAANATMAATTAAMAGTPNPNPGYLGIRAEQVDDCGVRVVEVVAGGPASKSTLKADDVIVAMDGTATPDILTLRQMVMNHKPEDAVTLTVENTSGQMDVKVTLGSVPANAGAAATMPATRPSSGGAAATMAATMAATQ